MADGASTPVPSRTATKERIALDVGGVLVDTRSRASDAGADHAADAEFMEGAFDAVRRLAERYDLYIISFCGATTERHTRARLREAGFDEFIPAHQWHFTRDRRDKPDVMERYHITTLVDDRRDIVQHVRERKLRGLLFTSWDAALRTLLPE